MDQNLAILLVEDNSGDANLFRIALKETDTTRFSLHHVETLEKAGKALSEHHYDIIMLDLSLPDSQGLETVTSILKAAPGTPVVVLTGTEDDQTALLAVQRGAQDYLKKGSISSAVLVRSMIYAVERHRLKTQLEAMNETRNNLLSIISHDLKSPFYSMVQVLKHLLENFETIEPATLKNHLSVIGTTTETLYELVENLLKWTGSQTGRITVHPETVNLHSLTQNVLELLLANAERKSIRITNMVDPGTTCWADRNMVHTILRNLISNGIKFTRSGGTVTVSVVTAGEDVTVRVEDTGLGMSERQIGKLFRTESRSSRTGTAGETGTGLGLILCKEFIEKNGGTISVTSNEGRGTVFTFTLPRYSHVAVRPVQ